MCWMAATYFLRVNYQVQLWLNNKLVPELWGWEIRAGYLNPTLTIEPPAPENILKKVSCSCKKGCNKICGCRKHSLKCSKMCSHCSGIGCLNAMLDEWDDDQETSETTSLTTECVDAILNIENDMDSE